MSDLQRPWLRLDPTELDISTSTDLRGVEIQVSLSPYDVPEGMRSMYDSKLRRVVIEFKYLDSEPFKREKYTDHIWLRMGRNSDRLLGFELETREVAAGPKAKRLVMVGQGDVVQAINRAAGSSVRPGSYRIVSHVVERRWQELIAGLLPE